MAKSKKVNMPSSQGGLLRFDQTDSRFQFPPETIIAAVGLIILLEIIFHSSGPLL